MITACILYWAVAAVTQLNQSSSIHMNCLLTHISINVGNIYMAENVAFPIIVHTHYVAQFMGDSLEGIARK